MKKTPKRQPFNSNYLNHSLPSSQRVSLDPFPPHPFLAFLFFFSLPVETTSFEEVYHSYPRKVSSQDGSRGVGDPYTWPDIIDLKRCRHIKVLALTCTYNQGSVGVFRV